MNIENWSLYYKVHEVELRPTTTQMCYEPRVNPEGNVFCMNFCFPSQYQINQPRLSYTKDLVDYMFNREVKYLEIFKDEIWIPEILDIEDRKIFIKWYGKTCNDLIYKENRLIELYPNWHDDIKSIILGQANLGYLKATMYPHSHYYDKDSQMRTIDFYATVERSNPYIEYKLVEGIVGTDTDRFDKSLEYEMLNVEKLFCSGLLEYGKWPTQLNKIHEEIYKK
jgi:hypothetical protein